MVVCWLVGVVAWRPPRCGGRNPRLVDSCLVRRGGAVVRLFRFLVRLSALGGAFHGAGTVGGMLWRPGRAGLLFQCMLAGLQLYRWGGSFPNFRWPVR